MTSLLPEEENNVTRLKPKSQTHNMHNTNKSTHDETRSFLNFSRENLSISHSDLEQGFNKPSTRVLRCCSRQTLLSCAALLLALACAGFELWKFKRVLANTKDILEMRRDVETLKHRLLEKDLLDELKAFEEQLYSEGTSEEDDFSSNPSSTNTDYDSNYDDVPMSPSSIDHETTATSIKSNNSASSSTIPPLIPCTSKDLEDVFAVLRRAETEHGQAFEQSVRDRERLLEEEREHEQRRIINEHRIDDNVKSKRELVDRLIRRRRDFYTRLKHPPKK